MIKVRGLYRVNEILNVVSIFILTCKTRFAYTMRRVTILLKKPGFIINFPHRFNSVNIKRQKALNIVLLSYCIALNLYFIHMRLCNFPFGNTTVIFFFCFSFRVVVRLRRY
jgi:hypothetical protein